MKKFTYTGKKQGVIVRGEIEAETISDAISLLKNRGIEVEELVEESASPGASAASTAGGSAWPDTHQVFEHRITPPKTNALAVVTLVISVLGVIVTWFLPIITQIAAIICGHIARSQIKRSDGNQTGAGMALAGLIISYLVLIVGLLVVIVLGVTIAEILAQSEV